MAQLQAYIRDIPDFPKKGVVFRDITTLLKDAQGFRAMGEKLYGFSAGKHIDKVVGIDSRGFIYGGYLAWRLNAGLVLVRKAGKLPAATFSESYALEYGQDCLELHKDAIKPGERVLLHDDLLATGGTASAACKLIEKAGGVVVQVSFLIELAFLKGRDRFTEYELASAVLYGNG